ncbi:hypothetical protein [Burkholderia sp. Se-20378]|uniref:hypothetical protein n=1 Tax=Burkholderia sp. Se-20378 TaxID=2703899 RepID=UPI001980B855|nr:hypothetical protein [Burkholderia sp. Se-20378]MBN3772352.1 hypothetical protein [Burkholderia sp. Se-20378]
MGRRKARFAGETRGQLTTDAPRHDREKFIEIDGIKGDATVTNTHCVAGHWAIESRRGFRV